ncbi:hypothetical protein PFUM301598_52830 [Pseudomonas fluorescens]
MPGPSIEADTAEFYYTQRETPQPNEVVFKKCTSAQTPTIKDYRDTLSRTVRDPHGMPYVDCAAVLFAKRR